MRTTYRRTTWIGLAALVQLAGCPVQEPVEFVAGGTGERTRLGNVASVRVLSPVTNLSIRGGTPVEVNWIGVATTNFATFDVIFDVDQDPDNDNEIFAERNLALTESRALLDTTDLEAGTFFVGVILRERNEIAAFAYAPGRLIVNQAAQFFFTAPRDNLAFDRTIDITPRFDVAWQLRDPDSTVTVEIFLDPDETPNGNEFSLRRSDSQTGDSFSFNLPTASFPAGVYRILAIVSDGIDQTAFYAPATIRLRARLAGVVDLRDLDRPDSAISGAVFEGFNPRDNAGSFVASCRDLDGDGFGDFIMLAQFGKPLYEFNLQRSGIGEAYLVYGRPQRFTGNISVNSIGRLVRGDVFTGVPEPLFPIRPSRGITSFAALTDWDLDGVREFAFGLPFTDSLPEGILDSFGYFRTGAVVIAAGNVLRPDFGFPGGQVIRLGEIGSLPHTALVPDPQCLEGLWGPKSPAGLPPGGGATFFLRHLADVPGPVGAADRLGCRLSSNDFGDQFGETISAYDFDGIIISAPNRDPGVATIAGVGGGLSIPGAGVISVYFNQTFVPFYPWLSTNAPPANMALGYGGVPGDPAGADLLPHHGPYYYIVDEFRFGLGFAPEDSPGYTVDPDDAETPCESSFNGGAPNFATTLRIWSDVPAGGLGGAKGLADFNADGFQDILIGHPLAKDGAGACFIMLGRLAGLIVGTEFQIEELGLPLSAADPSQERIFDGVRVVGAPGTQLGSAQDAAGDFNGDGVSDAIIGSPLLNNRQGGAAIFFGSREVINLTQEEIPLEALPARGLGVIFVGQGEGDLAGASVAGAGDIDGDGLDDVLIAAPNKSVRLDTDQDGQLEIDRTDCGVVYLIYGSPRLQGTLSLADIGTEKLPGAMFVGRNSGDELGAGVGLQGDRALGIATAGDVDGDGRRDLLLSSVRATPRDRVEAGEVYLIYGLGE